MEIIQIGLLRTCGKMLGQGRVGRVGRVGQGGLGVWFGKGDGCGGGREDFSVIFSISLVQL